MVALFTGAFLAAVTVDLPLAAARAAATDVVLVPPVAVEALVVVAFFVPIVFATGRVVVVLALVPIVLRVETGEDPDDVPDSTWTCMSVRQDQCWYQIVGIKFHPPTY